jgi:enoyl-CoA hydratase/carnithine racemase
MRFKAAECWPPEHFERRRLMQGPIKLVRSDFASGYENRGPIFEWSEGKAYLFIDLLRFEGKSGAILTYHNPPVHQVGNPGLDAFLRGLREVDAEAANLEFLILYGANDPVHAGGDLKESLENLDRTLREKEERLKAGTPEAEVDRLFEWADNRLEKGRTLHRKIRNLAQSLRVVAVCGGGTRFGGSAEIPLLADFLVGDSRSAMCFSEAMIGLIPGWAGIARALVKAGVNNAQYMAKTCAPVKAVQLKEIGIYNAVVNVPLSLPQKKKTTDPEADKQAFLEALEKHDSQTGQLLLARGLELAACAPEEIPVTAETGRGQIATASEISREADRRRNPQTYAHLWGKPLKEVKAEIADLGRPLAPQSIEALDGLFAGCDQAEFDEFAFVEQEMRADAGLYRDRRFRAGLVATLEQKVADFRI